MTVKSRIACCQVALQVGESDTNRRTGLAAAAAAAADGASIVVLPELSASGYVFRDESEARVLAEPADGPTTAGWTRLARERGVTVVGGICELGDDGLLYNSAVVVDSAGLRASYRKAHLWDAEKLVFTPGDGLPPVVETAETVLAVVICYDLEFPEWVRLPALAGAQLLCDVVRAQAAAAVNRMFIAVCDRVGAERGVDWVGGSVIIDPDGWPLAGPEPGDRELTFAADCDLALAADKRNSERNDVLADRRPDLYRGVLGEEAR